MKAFIIPSQHEPDNLEYCYSCDSTGLNDFFFCNVCLCSEELGQQIDLIHSLLSFTESENYESLLSIKSINCYYSLDRPYSGSFFIEFTSGIYEAQPFKNLFSMEVELKQRFIILHPGESLFYYLHSASEPNCLIYDSVKHVIKSIIDDKSFADLSCPEKPSLFAIDSDMTTVAVTFNSSADIFVLSSDVKMERIPIVQHGLQKIDGLQLFKPEERGLILLVWNLKRRLFVAMLRKSCGIEAVWLVASVLKPKFDQSVFESSENLKVDWSRSNGLSCYSDFMCIYLKDVDCPYCISISSVLELIPAV